MGPSTGWMGPIHQGASSPSSQGAPSTANGEAQRVSRIAEGSAEGSAGSCPGRSVAPGTSDQEPRGGGGGSKEEGGRHRRGARSLGVCWDNRRLGGPGFAGVSEEGEAAQEPPLSTQIALTVAFVERAKKRLATHDAQREGLVQDLESSQARLNRLRSLEVPGCIRSPVEDFGIQSQAGKVAGRKRGGRRGTSAGATEGLRSPLRYRAHAPYNVGVVGVDELQTTGAPRHTPVWGFPKCGARVDVPVGRGGRSIAFTPGRCGNALRPVLHRCRYGLRGIRIGEASHPGPGPWPNRRRRVVPGSETSGSEPEMADVPRRHRRSPRGHSGRDHGRQCTRSGEIVPGHGIRSHGLVHSHSDAFHGVQYSPVIKVCKVIHHQCRLFFFFFFFPPHDSPGSHEVLTGGRLPWRSSGHVGRSLNPSRSRRTVASRSSAKRA